jgi:hypothetical protein
MNNQNGRFEPTKRGKKTGSNHRFTIGDTDLHIRKARTGAAFRDASGTPRMTAAYTTFSRNNRAACLKNI